MKKLRLILFEDCNRNCEGCCNNDWDLKNIPVVKSYSQYDEVILTGGEPMLDPELVLEVVNEIRKTSDAKIILYTAETKKPMQLREVLKEIDGITLTLHEQKDVVIFTHFKKSIYFNYIFENKSLRLNVFSDVDISNVDTTGWQVKENIKWIKNCPLPENEVLMRLN